MVGILRAHLSKLTFACAGRCPDPPLPPVLYMSIYHLHIQNISRGKGRSAVAAMAYRAGVNLWSAQERQSFDYTKKEGVVESRIVIPENAPDWAKDRQSLWNNVEMRENRVNSNYAKEIEFSLPKELPIEKQKELAHSMASDLVKKYGVVADYAIHNKDPNNPHVHLAVTTRPLDREGWGGKIRELDHRDFLMEVRETWAKKANHELERIGAEKIDHRTLEAQGINREPTKHRGVRENAMEDKLEKMNRVVDLVKGENYEPGRRLEKGRRGKEQEPSRSPDEGNERQLSAGAGRIIESLSDRNEKLAGRVLQNINESERARRVTQEDERVRKQGRGVGREKDHGLGR